MLIHITSAQTLIEDILAKKGVNDLIDAIFTAGGRPVLFAGAVRDALLTSEGHNASWPPRDFDIGVFGLRREIFDETLQSFDSTLNRYSGYVLDKGAGLKIDVWRIEETCGLVLTGEAPTQTNVLRSFIIGLNAAAFDLHTGLFQDYGCRRSMQLRTLSFLDDAIIHSHATFAAKALVVAMRFQIDVESQVWDFVFKHLDILTLQHELAKARNKESLPQWLLDRTPRRFVTHAQSILQTLSETQTKKG